MKLLLSRLVCSASISNARNATLGFLCLLLATLLPSTKWAHAQTFQHIPIAMHAESNFVLLEGSIEEGAADRFRAFMLEQSDVFRVRMNSPGGNVQEALKLGRTIRELGLNTEVGGLRYEVNVNGFRQPFPDAGACVSACALAFLGGVVRDEASATSIGLHQISDQINSSLYSRLSQDETRSVAYSMAQSVVGEVVAYMMEMGVDARVFTVSSQAQGLDSFEYLTLEQAIEFDVVTPIGFGEWRIEPHNEGIVSFSKRQSATRPYDTIYQVTSYCKSDGTKHLLFTSAFPSHASDRVNAESFPHFSISTHDNSGNQKATYNFTQKNGSFRAWYNDGSIHFEVHLADSVFKELVQPGRLFGISHTGRANGQYFWDGVLSETDVSAIAASFKLCAI